MTYKTTSFIYMISNETLKYVLKIVVTFGCLGVHLNARRKFKIINRFSSAVLCNKHMFFRNFEYCRYNTNVFIL